MSFAENLKSVSELRSILQKPDRQIRLFRVDLNLQRFWSLRSSISIIARNSQVIFDFCFQLVFVD